MTFYFCNKLINNCLCHSGTLGKIMLRKTPPQKCRNVIKSRAPGWNGSKPAGCHEVGAGRVLSPPSLAWAHPGGSIHVNYEEMPRGASKVHNSDHPVSERRIIFTSLQISSIKALGETTRGQSCLQTQENIAINRHYFQHGKCEISAF